MSTVTLPSSWDVNCVAQMLDACCDAPTFGGHIDYGKEASQLHSLLVDLLDKVDNKVLFCANEHCSQGRSDGGVYRYIYTPQNQSTLQIFTWLLVVFFFSLTQDKLLLILKLE